MKLGSVKALFPLLSVIIVTIAIFISGCAQPAVNTTEKKEPIVAMVANKVDQFSKLGDKVADGQYILVTLQIKNLSNKTLTIKPTDLSIEPITEDTKEQYSQPIEKGMTIPLMKVVGNTAREKVLDYLDTTVHPRLQVERYLVFMLPVDAKIDKYQISYKPASGGGMMGAAPTNVEKVSIGLVSAETVVTDHRDAF